jgi:hypothetical protein
MAPLQNFSHKLLKTREATLSSGIMYTNAGTNSIFLFWRLLSCFFIPGVVWPSQSLLFITCWQTFLPTLLVDASCVDTAAWNAILLYRAREPGGRRRRWRMNSRTDLP